jgi:hypothetical protein
MAGIETQNQVAGVQKWLPTAFKGQQPAEAAPKIQGDSLKLGNAMTWQRAQIMASQDLEHVSTDDKLAALNAFRGQPWTFGNADAFRKLAASIARTNPDRLPKDVVALLGQEDNGLIAFALQVSTQPAERIKYFTAMPGWLLQDLAQGFRMRGQDTFARLTEMAMTRHSGAKPAAPQTPATPAPASPKPAGLTAQQALSLAQRELNRVPTAERVEALKVLAKEPWNTNVQRAYIDIAASLARSWPDKLPADAVEVMSRDQLGLVQFMSAIGDDSGERLKYLRSMPDELLLKLQDAFIEAGGPRQILGEIHAALGHG